MRTDVEIATDFYLYSLSAYGAVYLLTRANGINMENLLLCNSPSLKR